MVAEEEEQSLVEEVEELLRWEEAVVVRRTARVRPVRVLDLPVLHLGRHSIAGRVRHSW